MASQGHELTVAGYVVAALAAIIVAMSLGGAVRLVIPNVTGAVADIAAVVNIATAIGVGVAVALGLDRARAPILTHKPTSAIPMLGPGLQEA